jgi:hypothetical protein
MKMTFLYNSEDGETVVRVDKELLTLLTPQDSPCIQKTNQELRLHDYVTRAREVLPKYNQLKEHFGKFLSAITG